MNPILPLVEETVQETTASGPSEGSEKHKAATEQVCTSFALIFWVYILVVVALLGACLLYH